MMDDQTSTESTRQFSAFNVNTTEMAAAAKKCLGDFLVSQGELLNEVEETNRRWFDRVQAETDLASELTSRLMSARSVPEAMNACGEWTTRHFEIMAENGNRLLNQTQRIMAAGARVSNTWLSRNAGANA